MNANFGSKLQAFLATDQTTQNETIRKVVASGDRHELQQWVLAAIDRDVEEDRLNLFAPELLLGLLGCKDLTQHDLAEILNFVDLTTQKGAKLMLFQDLGDVVKFNLPEVKYDATALLAQTFVNGTKPEEAAPHIVVNKREKANERQLMAFVKAIAEAGDEEDEYVVATWAYEELVTEQSSDAALALMIEHAWMASRIEYPEPGRAATMLLQRHKQRGVDPEFLLVLVMNRDIHDDEDGVTAWSALEKLDTQGDDWEFGPKTLANIISVQEDEVSAKARHRLREQFPEFNLQDYLDQIKH